jgi:hypothetical protein
MHSIYIKTIAAMLRFDYQTHVNIEFFLLRTTRNITSWSLAQLVRNIPCYLDIKHGTNLCPHCKLHYGFFLKIKNNLVTKLQIFLFCFQFDLQITGHWSCNLQLRMQLNHADSSKFSLQQTDPKFGDYENLSLNTTNICITDTKSVIKMS